MFDFIYVIHFKLCPRNREWQVWANTRRQTIMAPQRVNLNSILYLLLPKMFYTNIVIHSTTQDQKFRTYSKVSTISVNACFMSLFREWGYIDRTQIVILKLEVILNKNNDDEISSSYWSPTRQEIKQKIKLYFKIKIFTINYHHMIW
jgi:hypothetical protein